MTGTDDDSLDDQPMADLLRRFGAQTGRGANVSLSPPRRAALEAELDAVDAEAGRRDGPSPWRTWLWISAAAAALVFGAVLVLRAPGASGPELTAQVALAEPIRGAPAASAFTIDVVPHAPGFARIDVYGADGRRRMLPLRDGQFMARVTGRTRFGEFDLADTWRILVVFAATREALAAPDAQTPELLPGAEVAERSAAFARAAADLRRHGIAATELVLP